MQVVISEMYSCSILFLQCYFILVFLRALEVFLYHKWIIFLIFFYFLKLKSLLQAFFFFFVWSLCSLQICLCAGKEFNSKLFCFLVLSWSWHHMKFVETCEQALYYFLLSPFVGSGALNRFNFRITMLSIISIPVALRILLVKYWDIRFNVHYNVSIYKAR